MPRGKIIYFLTAPFLVSVIGAWAWFKTDLLSHRRTAAPSPGIWLTARTNVPGYVFVPEPVSEAVMKTLGTTNILNGSFYRVGEDGAAVRPFDRATVEPSHRPTVPPSHRRTVPPSDSPTVAPSNRQTDQALHVPRITVFLASWPSGNNQGLTAILHTPDICWGGTGWKPVDMGQPSQISIDLPGTQGDETVRQFDGETAADQPSNGNTHMSSRPNFVSFPFDYRIFELPETKNNEAAVWCALADGEPLTSTVEWGKAASSESPAAYYIWSRAVQLKQLFRATESRLASRGPKQFVRFSMPHEGDWRKGLRQLQSFGTNWLTSP